MSSAGPDRRNTPRADDPDLRGRRAEPRAYVVLPASAEAISGHRRVKLLDVSRTGARIEGRDLPATGKDIVLRCGQVDTFGTIAWSAGQRCGMQFDEPLAVNELLSLREMAAHEEASSLTPEERQAAADWQNGLAR